MSNLMNEYIVHHMDWSRKTFGDGPHTEGLCKHIEKELAEIREDPNDLMEWVDVIILAIDGAWRTGHTPAQILDALSKKQGLNFTRYWNVTPEDQPNEHDRGIEVMSEETLYKVCWKANLSNTISCGTCGFPKDEAQRIADELNKAESMLFHWVEPADTDITEEEKDDQCGTLAG